MEHADRIETLARRCLATHGGRALQTVQDAIARAEAKSDWNEAGLWHRVRLRIIRIAMPNAADASLTMSSSG